MKLTMMVATIALSLAALSGCTPSPEKVCAHALEVTGSELDKLAKGLGTLDKKDKKQVLDECVQDLARQKEASPEKYKVAARCATEAKDLEALLKCDFGEAGKKTNDATEKANVKAN